MLDHIFLSVSDVERSIAFYTEALTPLGITKRVDYDGKDGPPGHPDLKGSGPMDASSFGSGRVWRTAARRMSVLWRTAKVKSTRPMLPLWLREPRTMAHPARDSTTIRATMLPMFWIRTAIAWNSCARAGSTDWRRKNPSGRRVLRRRVWRRVWAGGASGMAAARGRRLRWKAAGMHSCS